MITEEQSDEVLQTLRRLSVRRQGYKQLGKGHAEARRAQAAQSSKDGRNAALQAKRIRKGAFAQRSPDGPSAQEATTEQTSVASLVETANRAAGNPGVRLGAVRGLRRLLSTESPPYEAILSAGVAQCLFKVLQQHQYSANELKLLLEATWALTNLAAGPPECVQAALPAAPLLVVLLQTSSSKQIAEQSAWALGNMAGESEGIRSRLQANGAVRPLLQLVLAATTDPVQRTISASATAAWALSSMLQGNASAVKEVLSVQDGAQSLLQLLGSDHPELVVEVAWAICHMTHGQESDLNRLVHLNMVSSIMQQAQKCVHRLTQAADVAMAGFGLLRPLLRTLANVAAGGGRDAYASLLSSENGSGLAHVVAFCLESGDEGFQAEAAWMCVNLAAAPLRAGKCLTGRQLVLQPGITAALMSTLTSGSFHAQREAAYAFANLLAGTEQQQSPALAKQLMSHQLVDPLGALLRSGDSESMLIALQLLNLVIAQDPSHMQTVRQYLEDSDDDLDRAEAHVQAAWHQLLAKLSRK